MSYIQTIKRFRWDRALLIVIAFIPYVDSEILGVIPLLRDVLPGIDPIYVTRKSWTELARLILLIVVPVIDGEIIKLLTGQDVNQVIADS